MPGNAEGKKPAPVLSANPKPDRYAVFLGRDGMPVSVKPSSVVAVQENAQGMCSLLMDGGHAFDIAVSREAAVAILTGKQEEEEEAASEG
jgi:hypothetical protein